MPPPNRERRDQLADAAVTVLARQGSHGLTHRAVDAAAAVPTGTTSRYFRSREALLDGIIDRITDRLGERITTYRVRPIDPDDLEDALVAILTLMQTEEPDDPLALFELHLEATRNPVLRAALTTALHHRRDLIRRQCRAAGIDLSDADAMLLEMSMLGILFTALTTDQDSDPEPAIRAAVATLLGRYRN